MKAKVSEQNQLWTKAPVANLLRYEPSGIYFARAKVRGKLIRKSLDTNVLSVAKLRLSDVLDAEHKAVASSKTKVMGKMTFGDALAAFKDRVKNATEIKESTKHYNDEAIIALLRTWPGLSETDIKKITPQDCIQWRASIGQEYSAPRVNGILSVLRRTLDIALEAGIRYDNPAKVRDVKRARVRRKELRLPEPTQFWALIKEVRGSGSGYSPQCADAIEFFAFVGPRLNEAARIYGRDCSFSKNEIVIRGDSKTGTKNWEIRRVPMIPETRTLLERLKKERGEQEFLENPVLKVRKFTRSLKRACKKLGLHHLTHHDLRHLFATRCIESGVDIPTVAKWLGHKDGGALAMKTYGHLRDEHSAKMAKKVQFSEQITENVILKSCNTPAGETVAHGSGNQEIGKAKAKYGYPWWASKDPLEVFWGQLNEAVQIVDMTKFHACAKEAMEREIFEDELQDKVALKAELTERIEMEVLEKLSVRSRPKVRQLTPSKS
ncbi:MAG: Integrase family protein [Verrucomicrobiales bacterium]|nr:Integrase family protein [Verrucomicrobiales bacterium]